MSTRTQAGIGVAAAVGAALLLVGCATAGTGAAPATSGSPASALASPSAFTTVSGGGPESGPVDPVPASPESGTGPLPTPPSAVETDPSGPDPDPSTSASASVPDWPTIQAAVAEADAQLATAKREGWWSGPVCSPDIEQHRANAGQDPLSDEQLRAECAANLAEFRASGADYAALQALDPAARTAELARVGALLGLPAGQEPTVGQVVVAHGCEQGWITDPADCAGIPAG